MQETPDLYDFYTKMEKHNIMLSFKGLITSELLTSVLQIMENKMEVLSEPPKTKKKVFNVLVECLQNLYHHIDEAPKTEVTVMNRSAIFMIGKRADGRYYINTGNFINSDNAVALQEKIDTINKMDKEELKVYYKEVLNNGQMSSKGGGGLGIIDIARKSGEKLEYDFMKVDETTSFFSLNVNIAKQPKPVE